MKNVVMIQVLLFLYAGCSIEASYKLAQVTQEEYLHAKVKEHNLGLVYDLLKSPLCQQINVNYQDEHGNTALHLAAQQISSDYYKFLNENDKCCIRPFACQNRKEFYQCSKCWSVVRQCRTIDLLLAHGAKLDIPNNDGKLPCYYAVSIFAYNKLLNKGL